VPARGLIVLLAALAATLAGPVVARADSWTGDGFVQAPGGPYLTDTFGRKLDLHGVNLVAKCGGGAKPTPALGTPCVGQPQGPGLSYVLSPEARDPARRFTAADARTLARLGFDSVRLGVLWEGLEPGPKNVAPNDPRYCAPHRAGTPFPSLGKANPYGPAAITAYLKRTDRIVDLLARAGLRVIIDMHQDVYGSSFYYPWGATPWNGEGAPAWATCTDKVSIYEPIGWGSAYLLPAVQIAIHHFWANNVRANLQGQFAHVWETVAQHYRANPDVIGYEVTNEPNDFLTRKLDSELQCDYGGPVHEPRSCRATHPQALPDGLIGAIQSADPNHVVLFEPSGATGFGAPELIGISEPLRFKRLALAFHVYGSATTQIPQTADERAHTRTLQPGGPAWIMDEFGATNVTSLVAGAVNLAEAANLSWDYWEAFQLDDPTAGGPDEALLDQQTRRPYAAQAHVQSVPYAAATAGTPGPQSFNARTRKYRYRYTVAPGIEAPTEIIVPGYTFPRGYTVGVVGANVLSSRNAGVLELAATPGAKAVQVTVAPR
jgi:endoglycosylceramidase